MGLRLGGAPGGARFSERAGSGLRTTDRRGIWSGIFHAGVLEAFLPEEAAVAAPAGVALGIGVVAAPGQSVVDSQLGSPADDLRLGAVDQRSVDVELPPALDTGPRRQPGQPLEGLEEL